MENPDLSEELGSVVAELAAIKSKGWPLSKRETYMAFSLMGLTSRLQPSAAHSSDDQERLVALAGKMADFAVAENEKIK